MLDKKEVYKLLRYGVSVREELGELKERAWFINWKEPLKNLHPEINSIKRYSNCMLIVLVLMI